MSHLNHQFAVAFRWYSISLFVLSISIMHSIVSANDSFEERDVLRLRGEFKIGKEGRLVLLPVEIDGNEFLFLFDTGACRCGFDVSFRSSLGKPRGSQLLKTPAGLTRVQTYDWPGAKLGKQTLRSESPPACVDLAGLREATNEKIFGIIGMDVLRNSCVQIDFDRGFIRFLDSSPNPQDDLGVRIPIEFDENGAPYLRGVISDDVSERFLIDTGAHGNSLRSEFFDQLLEQNLVRLGGSFSSVTVGGDVQGNRGRIRRLSIGPITQEGLRSSRLNLSSLGLRYFSRFLVTFDFPAKVAYLREGPRYLTPEPRATSGMALNWIDGKIVVKSVKIDGPASAAGIRTNDILVHINGKESSDYDHFSLRCLLTSEGGIKVLMRIRRDHREFNVDLTLKED